MELYQKSLKCQYCFKVFEKRNILKRHLREKHYCGNVYKCNMCSISFARKERLMRHLKSVHFNLKFECKECQMKFVEKFKHNHHMVHAHNYNYCSECKVSFPPQKYGNRQEHVCESIIKFYKCHTEKCKGKKKYNRLNFFIRHLQFEHNVQDFERLKTIINQNTYEMQKKKKKSRIKAKTLENNFDEPMTNDLKEILEYAQQNCQNEMEDKQINAQDIIDQIQVQKQNVNQSYTENSIEESQIESKEDNSNNYIKQKKPEKQIIEEDQLKELMRNINIICMMENNQKKYFNNNSSIVDDDYSLTNKDADQIILGKRGRPSKKLDKSLNIVDKVMGSYLSKIQDNIKVKTVVVKRNYPDFQDKEILNKKIKEKKKIKPVYYDDILMETLNITRRVKSKKPIFSVRRNKTVLFLNQQMLYADQDLPFVDEQFTKLKISSDTRYNSEFEKLKQQKQKQKKIIEKKLKEQNMIVYKCDYCQKQFYNVLGLKQHLKKHSDIC